ncbi:MAG: hypothetical protein ACK5LK_08280 [Chthoniobacterales bacterium]
MTFTKALPLFLILLLSGCLYENAPTKSSASVNTWLFGKWEHKTEKGLLKKLTIGPLEGSRDSQYVLYLQEYSKSGKLERTNTYTAWHSRVGSIPLITIAVPTEQGTKYQLVVFQLLSPLTLRVRELQMTPEEKALSSFQLRVALRKKFQDGTLLADEVGAIWTKVSEIYRPEGGLAGPQPDQPLRNLPPIIKVDEASVVVPGSPLPNIPNPLETLTAPLNRER